MAVSTLFALVGGVLMAIGFVYLLNVLIAGPDSRSQEYFEWNRRQCDYCGRKAGLSSTECDFCSAPIMPNPCHYG